MRWISKKIFTWWIRAWVITVFSWFLSVTMKLRWVSDLLCQSCFCSNSGQGRSTAKYNTFLESAPKALLSMHRKFRYLRNYRFYVGFMVKLSVFFIFSIKNTHLDWPVLVAGSRRTPFGAVIISPPKNHLKFGKYYYLISLKFYLFISLSSEIVLLLN